MARVSTYLNFEGQAEEAFAFYAEIFSSAVTAVTRFGDTPFGASLEPADQQALMHIELPILNGHVLMATDMLASQGHSLRVGNNTTISLELDTVDEARALFTALCAGGSESTPFDVMPWGAWWGCTLDRFNIRWMVNAPHD